MNRHGRNFRASGKTKTLSVVSEATLTAVGDVEDSSGDRRCQGLSTAEQGCLVEGLKTASHDPKNCLSNP